MTDLTGREVFDELRDLSPECLQEVRDFIGYLKTRHARQPQRGSLEAIRPFRGAWQMTPDERARIEREIEQMRNDGEDER